MPYNNERKHAIFSFQADLSKQMEKNGKIIL